MVARLKGKNGIFQGKTEKSGWLGSRDSNPDSMIQSHVSIQTTARGSNTCQNRLKIAETMVLGLKIRKIKNPYKNQ